MQTTLKFDIRNYVDHNFDLNDDDDEELTGMLHTNLEVLGSLAMVRGCYRIYPKGICLKSSLEGRNLVFLTRSLRTFV